MKVGFKRNLVGIVILLLGVFAGVLLVEQSQEYREKAKKVEVRKVTICHKTDSVDDPWVEMEVDEDDLKIYLNQGDIIGECPDNY